MLQPTILINAEPEQYISMEETISSIEDILMQGESGDFYSPPRQYFQFDNGKLIFTVGGKNKAPNLYSGFRVYHSLTAKDNTTSEITAVYNSEGILYGLYIGTLLGEWRCGAIGGVAIKKLAPKNSKILGVLGAGHQARTQILGALAAHKFEKILVYCRNYDACQRFVEKMQAKYNIAIIAATSNIENTVRASDVLICATSSQQPILDVAWLKPSVHINNIGAKLKDNAELPLAAYLKSDFIYTDSINQAHALDKQFILYNTAKMKALQSLAAVTNLSDEIKMRNNGMSIFISLGLAGTEVAIAKKMIQNHAVQSPER